MKRLITNPLHRDGHNITDLTFPVIDHDSSKDIRAMTGRMRSPSLSLQVPTHAMARAPSNSRPFLGYNLSLITNTLIPTSVRQKS